MPNLVIRTSDVGPADLVAQLPVGARLLRKLTAPDAGDYTLAELSKPLTWTKDGSRREIRHVVVSPHLLGTFFTPGVKSLGVKLAYITDERQVDEASLDFAKAEYVALVIADVE